MNRATIVTGVGLIGLASGGVLGLLGHLPWALVGLSVGVGSAVALTLAVLRKLQSADRGTQQRMLRDRDTLRADIRHVADSQAAAAKTLAAKLTAVAAGPSTVATAASVREGEGVAAQVPAAPLAPALGNTLGVSAVLSGVGPVFEFADRAHRAPAGLETFAVRVKSTAIRDAFARAATGMQFDAADVVRILRVMRAGHLPGNKAVYEWNPRLLLTLARVMANQRLLNSDVEDAEVIFNAVRKIFGAEKLGKSDGYLNAEVLATLGRHREVPPLLKATQLARRDPVHASLLTANGYTHVAVPQWESWAQVVNKVLANDGRAPLRVLPEDGRPALDRLTTDVEPRTVDGPLITIIVPTFNGSTFIRTTLECLVRQTWKNLEIIVVDDFSTPEHQDELRRICADFDEVTLLHQPSNLGAYPARNRALTVAAGALITVHDDDDWSHPEKLEVQARHLLDHPDVAANMTRHCRATEDLVFTRINNNPSFSQGNFSSLMFRRELVDQIGPWDEVNRGADAEFRDRIVVATHQSVELLLEAPLSFTRTHAASLTATEIGRGYIDPSRLFYQAAYQRAHEVTKESEGKSNLEFPRPLNMAPGNRGTHLGEFDVVFGTDFRFPGGTTHLTLNEIQAAAESGLRVGMIHMVSPLNGSAPLNERALEVAALPGVAVLSLLDKADVALLLIRHPSVLEFAEGLSSKLTVRNAIVIVNNPPVLTGGTGFGYELSTVRANARHLFGVVPRVFAESGVTLKQCRPLFATSELENETWPGFVDISGYEVHAHDFDRRPVLGRHSRDAALKWPALRVIQQIYRRSDAYDVRILGGINSLDAKRQEYLTANAEVHGFGALPVPEFLASLDFWSYFHADELTESFGMSTVEALASGLVVILPPYMKENFGEAAVYAEPQDVAKVVSRYWSDPALYRHQSALARDYVEQHFSQAALESRLRRAMDHEG